MSLSKYTFDKARHRANERLSGWVTDVRQENEVSGIQKLQREYKHIFKKIEYIPKGNIKIENDGTERQRHIDEKNEEDDTSRVQSGARVSAEARDSNSSNLSSRLEHTGDEIRITESRTPFGKPPLLIVENEDNHESHTLNLNKPSDTMLNSFMQRGSGRRRSAMLPPPGILPSLLPFQRRRRSSQAKRTLELKRLDIPRIEKVSESDEGDEDDDSKELDALFLPSVAKKSSGVFSTPQKATKSYKVSKGGPVDLLLRRANRHYHKKHSHSRHDLPTVKADLTSEERHQEIMARFRRCIRLLIHVRVLLNVSRIRIQEEEKSKGFKRFDGGMELSFDASMFKCAVSSYSGITSRAKQALKKNPRDRTEEDAKILMEVLLRLPMFMKYPKTVKQALAHMMWYDVFQDGRVIVKQGDPGTRMYFVISGEVDLKRTDVLDTGEEICYRVRTVQAGTTFGELALIRNMKRDFTAVCKGTSEFLSLSKDEFNHALRSRWERDCNKRFNFLRTCEHFNAWTDKQLQLCADSSELKEYKDNKVILGDVDNAEETVCFIRKGKCDVVRRILVVRHQSPYQRPNILLPQTARRHSEFLNKSYCRDRRISKDEIRFLTVTTLYPGNYFGVGENLRDTFILSRGKTELLMINPAQFSIQGKSEQLRRLKRERESSIPSNKELYERFQENRKWFEYRDKLLKDILLKKPALSAGSMSDIPRSILNEPTIPRDIVSYNY